MARSTIPPLTRIKLLSAAALLGLTSLAYAQIEIGTIKGTVADPSHARVAKARIVLENPLTGSSWTEIADDQGHFDFENVPYGSYLLRIDAQGFHNFAQELAIRSNVPQEVEIQLQVTVSQESVTVRAAPDIVGQDVPRTETVVEQNEIKVSSGVASRNPFQSL